MRLASDRVLGVVELPAGCDGDTARRIVTAAFNASVGGTVALLVDERARGTADRILDELVLRFGTEMRGVLFVDPSRELDRAMHHAAAARLVVVRSARLAGELRSRGVDFRSGDVGLAELEAHACGGHTITHAPAEPVPSFASAS